jgi:3-oxoacyl-(acyl-carrier-protein) synthase
VSAAPAVVITGIGVHGALGDAAATYAALAAGESAVRLRRPPGGDGLPPVPAAPAPDADPSGLILDRKLVKYMSPAARMAVVAAGRALADAGLLADERRHGLGLFAATGLVAFDLGSVGRAVDLSRGADGGLDFDRLGCEGLRACPPLMPFKMLLNMPLGLISIAYGIRGPNFILYPGADQAGACLEAAVRGIRAGRLAGALVGGTAQALSTLPLCTQVRLGRVASSVAAAQPFTLGHCGTAPADAAAFLVLEPAPAAAARGRRAYATLTAASAGRCAMGAGGRADHWRAAAAAPPDLLVSSGNLDFTEDRAELADVDEVWPGARPRVASYDGALGLAGAASPPLLVGLAALMIDRGAAPAPLTPPPPVERAARLLRLTDEPRRVLVSATTPEGAITVAVVEGDRS